MTWLVTGGAGYIGSHVVRELRSANMGVVAYDNLTTGRKQFVPDDVPLVVGDILDPDRLLTTLAEHNVTGVIHLAGYKYAGESVKVPTHTYRQNVTGLSQVLSEMAWCGIDRFVFSSSAAVYGTPVTDLVTEATPTAPESPYGRSKLIGEWLLQDEEVARGIRHTSLRYFNVVGSSVVGAPDLSAHNLLPKMFNAVRAYQRPVIYGDDYPTPDGTCVRDYVHVKDVALAHVAAAKRLDANQPVERVYNLGSGTGTSVREIASAIANVTGSPDNPFIESRRPGDPARIVADGTLAARDLDWRSRNSLKYTVSSAWQALEKWERNV